MLRPLKKVSKLILLIAPFFFFIGIHLNVYSQLLVQAQSMAGLDHVYTQRFFSGGGIAFFDLDNDGDDDVYLTGGINSDQLFLNNGDGTFTDITSGSGLEITSQFYTSGVTVGDLDNDGNNDIYVTTFVDASDNPGRNLLFLNLGDFTFREIWDQNSSRDKAWSIGAIFLDHDLDGDLDIYTINYVKDQVLIFNDQGEVVGFDHTCYPNTFYENLGDLRFQEKANALGLAGDGCSLAVTATDYDLDGDIDIYLANDFGEFITPNKLYRNEIKEQGRFIEESEEKRANIAMFGMGIACADVDNDLDFDFYVTNLGRNVFLINDRDTFVDITDEANVANIWSETDKFLAVSWGTHFLDIDNDGDLDLYVANGYAPSSPILPTDFIEPDILFINDGNLNFEERNDLIDTSNTFVARGTAYSDYDNDGDLDIITVVFDRPSNGGNPKTILYQNQGSGNNWLEINLTGIVTNRNAYGSKATLFFGSDRMIREVSGGSSHCSQNSSTLHFGLGETTHIDSIQIDWTGNIIQQKLYDIDVNQILHITEDTSLLQFTTPTNEIIIQDFIAYPNPVKDQITIISNDLVNSESINIHIIDQFGNKIVTQENVSSYGNQIQIVLPNLTAGIYFLLIRSKRNVLRTRFVSFGR